MRVDWSVEIGPESASLEVPWRSEDGRHRFLDLKANPELLLEITETIENPELAAFLAALNKPKSFLSTAKCDTWTSDSLDDLEGEELEFNHSSKYASYVDVVFADMPVSLDFACHESLAKELTGLLQRAPDFAAMAEIVIRSCYFHTDTDLDHSQNGFAITLFMAGYGDDADSARKSWTIGLKLLENALRQLNGRRP